MTTTRAGDLIQRWYCSDCGCEHQASVIGGAHVHEFKQVEGQSSLECACGAASDGLTELQRAMIDHDKDMARLDRNRVVVPPLESLPLQSLKEVESTRSEDEDYHNAD